MAALVIPSVLLGVWACNADDLRFDSSGVIVVNEELGIRISGAEEWGQSAQYLASGAYDLLDQSVIVEVDGLGSREMGIYTQFENERQGGGAYTEITDVSTGDLRSVYYVPEESAIAFGDEAGGVLVTANTDGSYGVVEYETGFAGRVGDVQHAEDGLAALRLVEAYNDYSSLSDFMLITMYIQGQGAGPEFRSPIDCTSGDLARTPPVCTLFAEFCECAVCSVVGRTDGSCSACPNL
ncbi:MAG: hypothetical protein H6741_13120 [Alphaproteobacteria bacterium]|nr:hypothetical protein [Alphaproteobacteria bacterium]